MNVMLWALINKKDIFLQEVKKKMVLYLLIKLIIMEYQLQMKEFIQQVLMNLKEKVKEELFIDLLMIKIKLGK